MAMKRSIQIGDKTTLRVRVGEEAVHYAGRLVPASYILGLFGDVSTQASIAYDGDEGLLAAYNHVEFKSPVHAGDFVEVSCWVSKEGNTSRVFQLEAHRYIKVIGQPCASSASYLQEPELVAKAELVGVVPKNCQRFTT
jgi:3-aminobutyryl-CoA ammonia-lyase